MSERITEAFLREVENHYGGSTGGATPLALAREVRRLRGLIVAAQDDSLLRSQTGNPEGPLYETLMRHIAALQALEAEARAIREEQDKGLT